MEPSKLRIKFDGPNLTKGRTCGSCTACCKVLGVEELGKLEGQQCPHVCAGGCSIYKKRPESCREFECLWLQGLFEERDRPDRLRVVFDVTTTDAPIHGILAREMLTGRARRGRAKKIIEILVLQNIPIFIVNADSGLRSLLLPRGFRMPKELVQAYQDCGCDISRAV